MVAELRQAMAEAVPSDAARQRRLKTAAQRGDTNVPDAAGGAGKPRWKRKREAAISST